MKDKLIAFLWQHVLLVVSLFVMTLGVAMEVRCGSVTMPGEGLPVAISMVSGQPFAKVKIYVDIALVATAVASCYAFFGRWQWNIVGPGTLFAMLYVGMVVKALSGRMGWFDSLLSYRPGLRRYVYGLARFVTNNGMFKK